MSKLEIIRPEGCVAETQYSVTTRKLDGNWRVSTAEFSAVCALGTIGSFHNVRGYSAGYKDRGQNGLDKLREESADDLGRLIMPFCSNCPITQPKA